MSESEPRDNWCMPLFGQFFCSIHRKNNFSNYFIRNVSFSLTFIFTFCCCCCLLANFNIQQLASAVSSDSLHSVLTDEMDAQGRMRFILVDWLSEGGEGLKMIDVWKFCSSFACYWMLHLSHMSMNVHIFSKKKCLQTCIWCFMRILLHAQRAKQRLHTLFLAVADLKAFSQDTYFMTIALVDKVLQVTRSEIYRAQFHISSRTIFLWFCCFVVKNNVWEVTICKKFIMFCWLRCYVFWCWCWWCCCW